MLALPTTVGGMSVYGLVGTVRWALAVAKLPDSDTVAITITLERLVSLVQTVTGSMAQQLHVKRRCRPM